MLAISDMVLWEWGCMGGGSIQLPRAIEGGVWINDSREFEFPPSAALATSGGWGSHQGKVV